MTAAKKLPDFWAVFDAKGEHWGYHDTERSAREQIKRLGAFAANMVPERFSHNPVATSPPEPVKPAERWVVLLSNGLLAVNEECDGLIFDSQSGADEWIESSRSRFALAGAVAVRVPSPPQPPSVFERALIIVAASGEPVSVYPGGVTSFLVPTGGDAVEVLPVAAHERDMAEVRAELQASPGWVRNGELARERDAAIADLERDRRRIDALRTAAAIVGNSKVWDERVRHVFLNAIAADDEAAKATGPVPLSPEVERLCEAAEEACSSTWKHEHNESHVVVKKHKVEALSAALKAVRT